ncbi:unnamed protein product, partial [marine sediment metagenome]
FRCVGVVLFDPVYINSHAREPPLTTARYLAVTLQI